MGHIVRLEVENFKSYGGKQVVGPFKRFTAVIGPNGAGMENCQAFWHREAVHLDSVHFLKGNRT